jgi:hypothetical protein
MKAATMKDESVAVLIESFGSHHSSFIVAAFILHPCPSLQSGDNPVMNCL